MNFQLAKREKDISRNNKKRRAITATVIIGFFATFIIMSMVGASKFRNYSDKMWSTINAASKEYEKNINLDEAYINSMKDMSASLAGFSAYMFHEKGYNPVTRKQLTEQIGDYVYICYYLGNIGSAKDIEQGKLMPDRDYNYTLTPEQTCELLNNGEFELNGEHFTSHLIDNNNYAIICWTPGDIFKIKSILNAYTAKESQRVFRIDNETGIIEDSNIPETIGKVYDPSVLDYSEAINNSGAISLLKGKGIGLCLVVASEIIDNQTLLSYIPLRVVKYDYFSIVFLSCILLWGFLIMILFYYLRYIDDPDRKEDKDSECFRLYKNYYVRSKLTAHIVGLMIFALLTSLIMVFYFQTLLSSSLQDTDANTDLNAFSQFLDNAQENVDLMKADFVDMQDILCEAISDFFLKNPDSLTQDNLSVMNRYMGTVTSITIFDKNGNIEYDTGNNLGYTLSRDESSLRNKGEYNLWSVIDGTSDYAGYVDLSGDYYYAACRRQDKNGAVVVKVSYSNVNKAVQIMSPQETLKTADFGYSSRVLLVNAEPDVLYVVAPTSSEVVKQPNTFDAKSFEGANSGVLRYNGTRYFVNTLRTFEYTIASAARISDLYGAFNGNVYLCIFLAHILQIIMLLRIVMFKSEVEPAKVVKLGDTNVLSNTVENQMLDKSFRDSLKKMIFFVAIMIGAQLILDTVFSHYPIITYLFSSKWPKGLNLFSLTMILIIITIGFFGGLVLNVLILFFTKNMGPRGLTIGKMLGSLVRFLNLFVVMILCVKQVGFQMSAIITGAGILGGLTLFCAQNTVNDMLSGFFLVFENQFNIGDWITIGGLRGQVVEIAMRTTKLQCHGSYMVFNNSEVKKFTIEDYWDCGAKVDVNIAYKEDATKVIQLLKDSKERYRTEIPQIQEGPHIIGITEFGESGVSIGIRALADVGIIHGVEREIRRVTKHIFEENGIEIPFMQVTLHMGDELADTEKDNNENAGDQE